MPFGFWICSNSVPESLIKDEKRLIIKDKKWKKFSRKKPIEPLPFLISSAFLNLLLFILIETQFLLVDSFLTGVAAPGGPCYPADPGGRDQDWEQAGLRGLPRRGPRGSEGVRRVQDVAPHLPATRLPPTRQGRVDADSAQRILTGDTTQILDSYLYTQL